MEADASAVDGIWARSLASECEVCRSRSAQYRCPRCGIAYCGAQCFRAHSAKCAEGFARSGMSAAKAPRASPESRLRMEHTLDAYERASGAIASADPVDPWRAWWESALVRDAPAPPPSAPPRASPQLPYHLLSALYGYCYTMRLYNGDVSFDFGGACDALVRIAAPLSSGSAPVSAKAALSECIRETRQADLFVEYQWQVEVVRDVELCLATKSHVFRALSEMIAISREGRDKFAMRKLMFFFAWSQTLTNPQLERLREEVHQYYTSLCSLLFDVNAKELRSS